MLNDRDIRYEVLRFLAGLTGLFLLICIGCRLWHWWAGVSNYETFLGAVAGRPLVCNRTCWDYALWELCPNGRLAGIAELLFVFSVVSGAIFNNRSFYLIGVSVIVGGYLANACLLLKLMVEY